MVRPPRRGFVVDRPLGRGRKSKGLLRWSTEKELSIYTTEIMLRTACQFPCRAFASSKNRSFHLLGSCLTMPARYRKDVKTPTPCGATVNTDFNPVSTASTVAS